MDPELEAIRARRLQEMQMQFGKPGNSASEEQQKKRVEEEKKQEEIRDMFLSQILSQAARARLSNIAIAKPENARRIEDILITNAQRGAINEKLSEEQLIGYLEQINKVTLKKKTVVNYDRKRTAIIDSDEEDDDKNDVDDDDFD